MGKAGREKETLRADEHLIRDGDCGPQRRLYFRLCPAHPKTGP